MWMDLVPLGSTTSLILLLLLILTVLLFTRQAGLEKVSVDLVICWVNVYFSEMATIRFLLTTSQSFSNLASGVDHQPDSRLGLQGLHFTVITFQKSS